MSLLKPALLGRDGPAAAHHGRASCLLNLFGIGDAAAKFGSPLNDTIDVWVNGLEVALRSAGVKRGVASRLALGAVVRIEGALVVARALRDNTVFLRILTELESELKTVVRGTSRAHV